MLRSGTIGAVGLAGSIDDSRGCREPQLLVGQGSTAYFIEGLGDHVRELGTEALGIMFPNVLWPEGSAEMTMNQAQAHRGPAPRLALSAERCATCIAEVQRG